MSHWMQTKWDIWKFYVLTDTKTQPQQDNGKDGIGFLRILHVLALKC